MRRPIEIAPLVGHPELPKRFEALKAEFDPALGPQQRRSWLIRLRLLAEMLVVNDDEDRPIVEWWRDHFSEYVNQARFSLWASKGGWLRAREDRKQRFREQVEQQIGTDNVRKFLEDLKKLDVLHDEVTDRLAGKGNRVTQDYVDDAGKKRTRTVPIVPETFEKRSEAFSVLVALDRRRDEKRKGVLGGLPSAFGTAGNGTEVTISATLTLSPNVARAMAQAKMRAERDEIEGVSKTVDADVEEDD
jgi:hypothetical protein